MAKLLVFVRSFMPLPLSTAQLDAWIHMSMLQNPLKKSKRCRSIQLPSLANKIMANPVGRLSSQTPKSPLSLSLPLNDEAVRLGVFLGICFLFPSSRSDSMHLTRKSFHPVPLAKKIRKGKPKTDNTPGLPVCMFPPLARRRR